MARQSKYSKRRVPGGRTYGRYPENLQTIGNKIFSYGTHVATFKPGKGVVTKGYWSVTTSKHINYIAGKWGATVRKGK
jgi:hypothetical protein